MDIEFKIHTQVEAFDLQTKFATTALAPGMKTLSQDAIANGNQIDQDSLAKKYNLSQAAARNLITSGFESGVWDKDGNLTEEGHETAQTGEVLIDEVGPIRVWTFDHKITGSIFLHAERLGLLPPADAEPNNGHAPSTLETLSNGRVSKSIKPGDNRRWRIKYSQKESAWARQQKFCTPATLSWAWSYDGTWTLDDQISLTSRLSGTSRNSEKTRVAVNENFHQMGVVNPESSIREWLTQGRFASGPWDSKLGGLMRPFAKLSDAEKSMQTTNEELEDEIEGWNYISIRDLPLFSKTIDDASDWVIYLINEETPGYTTTEDTHRKLEDILERPFMCQDSEKVRERVKKSLASSRADPRLSKLLHAGDDLDSVALIPEWVLSQKRDENVAIHDGTEDYSEFVHQISQNMKGKIKKITYVNNYLQQSSVRKRIGMFEIALRDLISGVNFEVLTSHYPYTRNHGNDKNAVNIFTSKIKEDIGAKVTFMDAGKYGHDAQQCQTAHDRVLIIKSDKETRYWKITTKGIHIKDKSPCVKVELADLEKWLKNHLQSSSSMTKEELS